MKQLPSKINLRIALLLLCLLLGTVSIVVGQQISSQQVSASVDAEDSLSSVNSQDAVKSSLNASIEQGGGGQAVSHSADKGLSLNSLTTINASESSGANVAFSDSSGQLSGFSASGDQGVVRSKVLRAGQDSSAGISLESGGGHSAQMSLSGNGTYPSLGQFPDSTKGTAVLSPPVDYLSLDSFFKPGIIAWDPSFDSTPQLVPSYANVGTKSSPKRIHRTSQSGMLGNQLNGNALSDDLDRNGLSGSLSGNAQSGASGQIDSGSGSTIIPDPLATQDDSILGSDQPR